MNRREFVGLSSGALAATKVRVAQAAKLLNEKARPNFLFFIADDLNFRAIHSINNEEVNTPNIDRLVRDGLHFTHCFHAGAWSGAVCVPSRTMLNTGLSPFKARKSLPADGAVSIPLWGQTFRNAGYRTFQTGKWHLDAVSLQSSFSDLKTTGPGFLNSTPEMYNRPAPGNHWSPTDQSLRGHWLSDHLWRNRSKGQTRHSSEVYADSAIEVLGELRKQPETPFFAYVAFNAPHDPRQAPAEYQAMYPVEEIHVPPNFLPEHPFDLGDMHSRDEQLAPFPRTPDEIQRHRSEYYAIITHMDAQIGRVLDALAESGRADNTYVIFTSDHGLAVGEHGLMGKQNQYDCSTRVPLILRGPGIKPGASVDELVYQHSMYATTCELAGIPVPEHVEFPSLKPMIQGVSSGAMYDALFGWQEEIQRSVRTKLTN